MVEIELLYFDGCPSWHTALDNLREAIEEVTLPQEITLPEEITLSQGETLPLQVRLIEITNPQQAQDEHFLGSPSIRMNGVDLWPESRSRYDLSCRVYQTAQGVRGSPTVEMLRERIQSLHAE